MYPIEKYQFKVFEKTNEDGSKSSVVVAISTYCGRVVRGVAKCVPTDEFSLEVGKQLAAARCDLKVCSKRRKRLFEKKKAIISQLEKLSKDLLKITSYYNEAVAECEASGNRLTDIESKLR